MSKEKQIQEYETKQLIDALSKMPPMVIATAYLHAINYTLYGVDVTEKWITATQNACALEMAYHNGYYDALQKQVKSEDDCSDLCMSAADVPNFESKEYVEKRLRNYDKMLKSGILDCIMEKSHESENKE